MTEGIIIIGGNCFENTNLPKTFTIEYEPKEIAFLDAAYFKYKFRNEKLFKETKVIIVSNVGKNFVFDCLFEYFSNDILINKKSEELFKINLEKIIVVCSSEVELSDLPTGSSFTRRFDIFNLKS